MHIAVNGVGIVGVTTAFELAYGGHQVTVFERHSSVAKETSFAKLRGEGKALLAHHLEHGAGLEALNRGQRSAS